MAENKNDPIPKLISLLSRLPGIGRKTAQRLAYFILTTQDDYAFLLADAISDAKTNVKYCSVCYNLTDTDPCSICASVARDKSIICVVQDSRDVLAIERTKQYKGMYHVLGGTISPMDGIGPEELRIKELISRLNDEVTEVIMATALNVEGETTAMYISRLVKALGIKTTRIARGIPSGAELEYADEATLVTAMQSRREIE